MKYMSFTGLRSRLQLLVLAVIVPMLALLIFHGIESINKERLEALNESQRLARTAAALIEHDILEARRLFFTLSQTPSFLKHDSDASEKILAGLLKNTKDYSGLAALKPNGDVFASAPYLSKPVSFGDRPWFQRLVQTRSFVIGEYSIGRLSGKPTVVLGYPVLDHKGQLITILALGLDLDALQQKLLPIGLLDGMNLAVIDSNGTVLIRHPDPEKFAGKKMPESSIFKTVFTKKEGTAEEVGLDGVPRLYGFATEGSGVEAIHVRVGIPEQVAYAGLKRHMVREFALLVLVSALALLGAWLFGKLLIVSPLNRLIDVTKRLAEGDLTVRTGRSAGAGGLGLLAANFDRMAEALQRRGEERKLAEEALRANEEKYRLHFENVSDVIFSYDREFRILSVSPSLEHILGYRPEEFIGRPFPELNILPSEYLEKAFSETMRVFGGEVVLSSIYEFIARDGSRKYGEVSSTPVFSEGRVAAVVSVARDVSARKLAEEKLRLSEEKYHTLAESVSELIYRAEPETLVATYVNKAVERIYGYSVDEWLRDPDLWENAIHPNDRERVLAVFTEAQKAALDGMVEYRIIHRNGEIRWAIDRFAWEKDPDGKFISLNGIMSDITEHRQAEQMMRQQREELSQVSRLATVGEFAASVAHEVHQPLAAILNNAQAAQRLLSSDTPAIGEVRDVLQDIIDDNRRASEVIRHLRSFLKRKVAERAILDINSVIEEVLTILHGELLDKEVHVTSDLSPDVPHIDGCRIELQQVVMNLILNGCDAMMNVAPQRRKMRIWTSIDEPNSIIVSVEDSGTGLGITEIERVFDPYYTTKREGLGMGLSISKSIIAAHGGRIWAAINAEGGAKFCFTLPICTGSAASS